MKKGKGRFGLSLLLCLATLYIVNGSRRLDVFLIDFTVTDNMETIVLEVGTVSNIGHIRTLEANQEEDSLYVTFYSSYSNSSNMNVLNAKTSFPINLESDCDKIYFYGNGEEEWKLVLQKDNTGAWERVYYK